MATDFWSSSHYKRWIVDRSTIRHARHEDLQYVDDPDHLGLLGIFFSNLISKLCNKLSLRQRVIATASVFFKRFYLKSSYCETDPYLVAVACVYLAAKAEESPMHVKHVVTEARAVLNEYNIKSFPSDNSKLAEMEFYLMDDLECDLVVFHPYRTLTSMVKDQALVTDDVGEWGSAAGAGVSIEENRLRNNPASEQKLLMHIGGIQNAWFLINDLYGSDLCLLYPPHLIAIAALYLSCILHTNTRRAHMEWMESRQQKQASTSNESGGVATRRSTRHSNNTGSGGSGASTSATSTSSPGNNNNSSTTNTSPNATNKQISPAQDFVGFFASLNVNMSLISTIAQEIISFYSLCQRLKDDIHTGSTSSGSGQNQIFARLQAQGQATVTGNNSVNNSNNSNNSNSGKGKSKSSVAGSMGSKSGSGSRNSNNHSKSNSNRSTPIESIPNPLTSGSHLLTDTVTAAGKHANGSYEVTSSFLIQLLVRMRAMREADIAHPASGRPPGMLVGQAVNKALERAQAAG